MTPTDELRHLAAADALDFARMDALLEQIAPLVCAVTDRWKKHANAGGDPRLQRRCMGDLAVRFPSDELGGAVVSRLQYLAGAQHSPFASKARYDLDLVETAKHDQAVIELHCRNIEGFK